MVHRHPRPAPNRQRFDEQNVQDFRLPEPEFRLSENDFGLLDLRTLVDNIDNEGNE